MKTHNPLWKFFASVKLALFTLCCIAILSIIGTIIPQNDSIEVYSKMYGAQFAQFIELFSLHTMYSSWWFTSLLALLSVNLIVCSIDRFPAAWKMITLDNLSLSLDKIRKFQLSRTYTFAAPPETAASETHAVLSARGWKTRQKQIGDSTLFFAQKSAISRTGVYWVHLSILVIFAGAIFGGKFGFKGSIMLPELQSSTVVYSRDNSAPIDLGFEIRCERFDIEYYSNGMPKEYRSHLTILEDGKEIRSVDIEVNSPLQYKGITFYQSSYQGFRDFLFYLTPENSDPRTFSGEFQREIVWQENGLRFGILNLESFQDRITRLKIWFDDDEGPPSEFWMNAGEQVNIQRPSQNYMFSAKQRFATGLQVAKDPGVWIVYGGCALMLAGLYMSFFMSHRRLWLILTPSGDETTVELVATTNKNKAGFEKAFSDLAEDVQARLNQMHEQAAG